MSAVAVADRDVALDIADFDRPEAVVDPLPPSSADQRHGTVAAVDRG
jgi:hypothetical protein